MAKKKTKPVELTKKQIAHRRRLKRQEWMVYIGLALVTALVAFILGLGFYREYVAKPASPVAIVNLIRKQPIRLKDYQKRVRFERFQLKRQIANLEYQQRTISGEEGGDILFQLLNQRIQQLQYKLALVGREALDQMIEEELVRQEAERRGITVSDAEVRLEIEKWFGYERNPPTPTPTPITMTAPITITPMPSPMSEADFLRLYQETLKMLREETGFSEADLYTYVKTSLLYRKLGEVLASEVPTQAEHIHLFHILLDSEEEAQQVLERLKAGEDFSALAKELSKDEDTKDKGGELGWFPEGEVESLYGTDVEEAVFGLQAGQLSEVVKSYKGYHVFKVTGREIRPLAPEVLEARRSRALTDWLAQQRQTPGVVEDFWTQDLVPKETG